MVITKRRSAMASTALAVTTIAACGSATPSSSPTAGGGGLGPITVTMAVPQFGPEEAPTLAAFAALKSMGITINVKQDESLTQAQQTFVANQADMLFGATEGILSANAQGSDGVAIWEGNGDNWVLISKASLTTPQQLNGKPIATGPSGQTTYTLLTEGAKKLEFTPQLVVINGSGNRTQAMVQGQVAAAFASVSDFIAQDAVTPGSYHVLVSFQNVFPGFSDAYFWIHRSFISQHPAVVQAIVNALAVAYKRVNEDKAWYVQQVATYFPTTTPSVAGSVWDQFTGLGLWAEDGDLTPAKCTSRAQFLQTYGYIKSIPPLSAWCDYQVAEKAVTLANGG